MTAAGESIVKTVPISGSPALMLWWQQVVSPNKSTLVAHRKWAKIMGLSFASIAVQDNSNQKSSKSNIKITSRQASSAQSEWRDLT